jgi:hypothetical protein
MTPIPANDIKSTCHLGGMGGDRVHFRLSIQECWVRLLNDQADVALVLSGRLCIGRAQ